MYIHRERDVHVYIYIYTYRERGIDLHMMYFRPRQGAPKGHVLGGFWTENRFLTSAPVAFRRKPEPVPRTRVLSQYV